MSENTSLSGHSGSIEGASNPPEADPDSDLFKDSECGEPLVVQRLVLDFTPTEEDTDYIQKKCCAFWEFVRKQPELEALAALTDLDMSEEVSESGDYDYVSSRERPESTPKLKSLEKTAVSMLELVEEKGLIDRAFESRLPTSHCSIGLADYEDQSSDRDEKNDRAKGHHAEPPKLSVSASQKTKSQVMKKQANAEASPSVQAMCHELQEWDKQHPKSMEPPGPAPDLDNDVIEPPAGPRATKQCTCKTVCRVRKHSH